MLRFAPILVLLLAGCAEPSVPVDDDPSQRAQPAISWSISQASDSASVVSTDPGANWGDFAMSFSRAGRLSGAAGDLDMGKSYQHLAERSIGAGDQLSFCAESAGSLEVSLRHTPSNSVAREFIFASVDAC